MRTICKWVMVNHYPVRQGFFEMVDFIFRIETLCAWLEALAIQYGKGFQVSKQGLPVVDSGLPSSSPEISIFYTPEQQTRTNSYTDANNSQAGNSGPLSDLVGIFQDG